MFLANTIIVIIQINTLIFVTKPDFYCIIKLLVALYNIEYPKNMLALVRKEISNMNIQANLIVDLGNSETRIMVQHGKNKTGNTRQELRFISNQFTPLEESFILPDGYDESNTVVLKSIGGEVFANGLLVEKEYANVALRPTAMQKKSESKVSILSIQLALLEGQKSLGDILQLNWKELEVSWDLFLLLPPSDLETGGKQISDRIRELEEIDFLVPKFKSPVSISSIKIFPEGLGAYIGILMRKGKTIREGYDYLLNSKSLVMDIGAGTTDFFVVEGTQLIDITRNTVPIGGNNVIAKMKRKFLQHGIMLPDRDYEQSLITGTIIDGTKVLNISNEIRKSRYSVSQELINQMVSYLESTGYPIRQINYLVVVGGGSIPSELDGVENLSDFLVSRLKEFSPNIDLVDIPAEYKGEDKTGDKINPRLLNILGASIMAEKG